MDTTKRRDSRYTTFIELYAARCRRTGRKPTPIIDPAWQAFLYPHWKIRLPSMH